MRISDWSSDVCSSDLDTTERLRPPERGVDLLSGSACRKIHPLHAEPAEDAADQRFGGCVKRGGMDDDIAGLDQCKQRSEEHTSELQSLMRISYAVFCLKKKQTRKKQHNKTLIDII